ncbi:MAG: nickel pincer cofactor biosynthesis protein LarC [Candidatus Zixiibacteriota bacterium]|nr:MAG: nickel pincer cofactor biosynthesis protein LarC [candidate division Zixibacteria bacterium]
MKTAYFDSICGASGDMIVGAMLDCGLDFETLKVELAKLPLKGYRIKTEKTSRHHITATRFIVEIDEDHTHRHLGDIEKIIDESDLTDHVKERSINIFRRLALAEAKVHGEPLEEVHFHEVGMVDAILDVCGAVIGLEVLGIEKLYCSALTVGHGTVETQHGTMPVPAPATGELVCGFPIKYTDVEQEILTPTGAAVLTTLSTANRPQNFIPEIIGYGAGSKDIDNLPNLLRLSIGTTQRGMHQDEVSLLETNFDRTPPEQLGYLMDNLFIAGALDVFITPIQMKKNRPAQKLSVLCPINKEVEMAGIIFSSGGTLGLRRSRIKRWLLPRQEKTVNTKYGEIPVKLAKFNEKVLYFPEFEVVARVASKFKKGFDEIYFEILGQLRKET